MNFFRRVPNPASLTAEQRHEHRLTFVAKNANTFEQLDDGTLIATGTYITNTNRTRYFLAVFLGKALRPERRYYCNFVSESDRSISIERIKQGRIAYAATKAQRQAERSRPHSLKVGDVLYSSWGYDQTNVDFYEVIAVRGAVVDMYQLATKKTYTGDMTGTAMPVRGSYIGELLRSKRPRANNHVRLTSYSSAYPWDGMSKSWSSYA